MPALVAVLWGAFITIAGSLVKRVLVGLGFGVVTFIGMKFGIDWYIKEAINKLNNLPGDLLSVLNTCGLGNCISIITGAITIRMVLMGLNMVNDRAANLKFIGNKSSIWG